MKLNLKAYKNIVFDLGGVLLNINYHLTAKAFGELGIENFDELFSQAKQQHLFDIYEKGQISTSEFRNAINLICSNKLSNNQIDNSWNALLLDFPLNRFEILQKVKVSHRIFLLSNTTELHMDAFKLYLKNELGRTDFFDLFEKAYLSYEIGMRKPDLEIFKYVLNENKLNPLETLFIDDSIQHVKSARELGIQAYWLDLSKESIEDLVK